MKKLTALFLALTLLTSALPTTAAASLLSQTASNSPPDSTVHYSWAANTNTYLINYNALPNNVTYDEDLGAQRSHAYWINRGTIYGANGPSTIDSYGVRNSIGVTSSGGHYGLPYRTISKTINGTTYSHDVIAENLWFELAEMDPLDTTDLAAANISINYIYIPSNSSGNVAFLKNLQVYVSLDGLTYLPGYAGIRSATLKGGGTISTATGAQGLLYQLETENLLDIPGINPGDTIKKIKIMPDGAYYRAFAEYTMSRLSVNCYATEAAFDLAVPQDIPEITPVDETTMRNIVVAEGVRTANIPWVTNQQINTTSPAGSSLATGLATFVYPTGQNYRGPVYERATDSTRELFQSSIVNGVYGYNGAGYDTETAYGMDCQTFAFNALSRVTRGYMWAVMNTFGDPHTRLLGNLNTAANPFFSDVDIVDLNSSNAIYESYALAQAGDIALHYCCNENNSVHTRIVKRVELVRDSSTGAIDPDNSKIYFTEQGGTIINVTDSSTGAQYKSSSRVESSFTFKKLYSDKYVIFTLTDYASGGLEKEDVQMVVSPLVADGTYADGVHIAFSSNYRIIKYTVSLTERTSNNSLFTDTVYCKDSKVIGINYENSTLNNLLTSLAKGNYRLSISVDSGPLTTLSETQVPTTVKQYDFTVEDETPPCNGSHANRTALTLTYLNSLTPIAYGNSIYYNLPAGNYYLPEDIDFSGTIRIPTNTESTICLNGHTLRGTLAANSDRTYFGNAFLHVAGTLNLCDHTQLGKLQVNTGGEISSTTYAAYAMHVSSGGTLNFHSGNICDSRGRYGVVLINGTLPGGVMNMYGGAITGNSNVTGSTIAAAIEIQNSGTFNMYGGVISGNGTNTTNGGAVDLNGVNDGTPTFHMYGGTITDNHADYGGGVRVTAGATFYMHGGTISKNTSAKHGAGVYVYGDANRIGAFHMSGGTISENTVTATSASYGRGGGIMVGAYGFYNFSDGKVFKNSAISGAGIYLGESTSSLTMTGNATVTENTATTGGIGGGGVAVQAGTANLSGGFITKNSATNQGGGISVYNGTVSTANITISNNSANAGGGIFLGSITPNATVAPTLSLNSGTLLSDNSASLGNAIRAAHATITLKNGLVLGNNSTGTGVIYLSHNSTLDLLGGSICENSCASAALYITDATVNMSGGQIVNNTSSSNGGGVILAANGVLNLSGGKISDNNGATGKDIFGNGDGAVLNMTGGVVGNGQYSTLWFWNGNASSVLRANFNGGTVNTILGTGGSAQYEINLYSGNFRGLSPTSTAHAGIKVYGGSYASTDYLLDPEVCMLENAVILTTTAPVFKYVVTTIS